MKNGDLILSSRDYKIDFVLLLIYSLLPGIYKVIDNQMFMIFSVPIILYLLYRHWHKNLFYRWDIFFLFLLFYLLFLNIVQFFSPYTNTLGMFMGIFLDVIPMAGFLFSRLIHLKDFIRLIVPIGLIHLIIGILLYPMFGIVDLLGKIGEILTDGVAFGRMASVSGSLGFASLMFMTSIGALYYKRKYFLFLLFGVICAAQRSGWLACFYGMVLFCYGNLKRGDGRYVKYLIIGIVLFIVLLSYLISTTGFDISFFMQRFEDLDSAAGERNGQWIEGWNNFVCMPIGAGNGQIGQVAARYEESFYNMVPDGDYFRVLSEYGIMGGLFYIVILFLYGITLFSIKKSTSLQRCCILSIFGGLCIQMIGSNITEFFFTNFLYWTFVGYLFVELNLIFVSRKKENNETHIVSDAHPMGLD